MSVPIRAFGDVLRKQARSQPERRAYVFLGDGVEETEALTYRELDLRSRALAAALAAAGAGGERVLLLFRPGLDFIAAFLACLDAGALAVPCQPPHRRRDQPRLQSVARDAAPRFVLSHAPFSAQRQEIGERVPELAGALWLDTSEIDPGLAGAWKEPDVSPDTPAFLQYTSGSTGSPKGVVVTHGNLLHNEEMIRQAFGQSDSSVVVGWLPLYHDMGLIGCVLQPLHAGAACVLMPPAAFLQRPLRWLEAISRYRGTTSGGPDFAYDLCVRKSTPEQRAALDLSSWRVAFNGSEPVRAATLARFAEAFAAGGFRREAFYPCYGLAEATLFVAGGRLGEPAPVESFEGLSRVGHGGAWLGQRVEVVDPDTATPLPDGRVGEIWVCGESVARGYWGRPEESLSTFGASLAEGGPERFLRTGDLGFRHGGNLFLSGRLKDLLIVRGRNHHPEDLEATAAGSHSELRPGSVAAFAVDADGEERVVLVCEREPRARGPFEEIADAVRRAVAEEHQIAVHDVVVVSAGGIPRTSSNKVRRRACREAWLAGELPVVGHSPQVRGTEPDVPGEKTESSPPAAIVLQVREVAARVLRIAAAALPLDKPLAAFGLDSLAAAELKAALEAELGTAPGLEDLFESTVEEIAAGLREPARALEEEGLDEEGEHPLTDGQRALWFLDRLAPGSGLHTLKLAARVTGGLDEPALLAAVGHLVRRHAALRATFAERDGEPVQRFGGSGEGTSVKVALDPLPDGGTALQLAAHHLVMDFGSLGVLLEELAVLYPALRGGAALPALPPPASYAAHVRRLRKKLDGPEGTALEAFWLKRMVNPPEPLDFGGDLGARGARSTVVGPAEWERLRLEEPLATGLRQRAREADTTLFGVLLAAFETLLSRWTGSRDFVVGAPAACRTDPRSADVVGYVMNPLALRSDVAGDPTFRELLGRIRSSLRSALVHQEYPAHRLAERLGIGREGAPGSLFRTLLVFNRSPRPAAGAVARFVAGEPGVRLQLAGLELESLPVPGGVADLDLQLYLADAGDAVTAGFLARTDRLDAATLARMAGAFRSLLAAALARPETRLSGLSPWSEAECRQVLEGWGRSSEEHPGALPPVHAWIADQARRTPDAVAVESSSACLTYGDLWRRVSALAGWLRARGVARDSRVGVLCGRTPELIVTILGVLEAGAAYVPLDPGYPRERVEMLLQDAGAEILLTGQEPVGEPESAASREEPAEDTLAYVIFTSGSTGRPKGVMVPHRALAAYTASAVRRYALEPDDRILQFASPAFDASAEEIFPTLAVGATLVLRDEPFRGSIAAFLAACEERGITVLDLPTAYWHEVALAVETERLEMPAGVRLVILGGERALPERWASWRRSVGSRVRVVNTYGPTETTIVATGIDLGDESGELPIGMPVAQGRVALLGPYREPVPPGAPGEISIGGAGLARGYLGRPDQTAERFVPDPFCGPETAGSRLYRTGDLARWRPDGALEFLGRLDEQVKVRGFRVEPGEVEAALRHHPGVRDAAVAAREGRLVAYVVPRQEGALLSAADLGGLLRRTLADFLVPSAFVTLAEIPRTAGGKVDRRRLPEPPEAEETEGSAPRTPDEEILAAICGEVLGVRRVGREDDLFVLGCHSLLATRIVARAREAFGVEIPLARLFEMPTVAGLALELEQARRHDGRSLPPVEPADRGVDLPLSFPQERLWFLQHLDPASASYHVPRVMRLRGALPVALLEAAYTVLIERHEVLRTAFPAVGGRPVQRIQPPAPVRIPVVDLSGLPDPSRGVECDRLLLDEGRRPFDFQRGPLIRLLLLRLGPEQHRLSMTEHHLLHDGWTQAVLVRDLLAIYTALAAGERPQLPALPVQYADFAAWQRRWLSDEVLADEIAWWKRNLADAPPVLDLPTDRPRPAVQRFRGEVNSFALPGAEAEAARRLARKSGATLFMVLLAAFEAVLARATGRTDLCLGTGIANRRIREIEGMVGMVINTLVLRTGLEGDPSFQDLLGRVRRTCLDAYAHQDLPFEKLVDTLRPERSLSHMPLFQVIFAFMDAPMPELTLPGLELEYIEVHNRSAKFDVNMTLIPLAEQRAGQSGLTGLTDPGMARDEVDCLLEYDADLFDASTMERLASHWRRLLAHAAAAPSTVLSELDLLSDEERHQLLHEWSDSRRKHGDTRLLEQILRHAASRPSAPAVVAAETVLSYGGLADRSAALARRLRSLGVGPEVRVAVLLERSPELVAALLAVLRAGGAYVPLDPAYPDERLRFSVADSGAALLLTREAFAGRLGAEPGLPVLRVDDPWEGAAGEIDGVPDPENLAYVIYTSGSTGMPKGVAVPWRGLENLVGWHQRVYGLGPDDRCTLLAGIGFDASVWELWPALGAGAAVHVPPPDDLAVPSRLAAWLVEQGITRTFLPTPLAEEVLAEGGLESASDLRSLLTGGDRLRRGPRPGLPFVLSNHYGPTEGSVVATWTALSPGPSAPPIGRPVDNFQVRLLDRWLAPAPLGVPGEVALGGAGLARGYLGRPDLTAERFVPDPCAPVPGARLYRTGDLARYQSSGLLEFLGRIDDQVKLRGFRIEPAEIEAAIALQPGVERALVTVREDVPGQRRLVAYVVGETAGLRDRLRSRLPSYMVPSVFVRIDEVPLTVHGKVDYRALPAPDRDARTWEAPAGEEQEALARIWSEILECGPVGAHDNVFELGAHSLLVTRVVSRIRDVLGVELALRDLFESPTVSELAGVVRAARAEGVVPAPSLLPAARTGALPLSFAQQRLWFLDQLEPGGARYNIPGAIHLSGPLVPGLLALALNEVLRRHEILRTRFPAVDGEPVQEIAAAMPLAFPEIDLAGLPTRLRDLEMRRRSAAEARSPFDLARGPLLRATLLRLGEERNVVLLTFHHIVADGWSMGILLREVAALYEAFSGGEPSPLPSLPVQYADFSCWQRAWLQGDVLEEQLAWWRGHLAGAPQVLELPTDRPRPAVLSPGGAHLPVALPADLIPALLALCRQEGATPFMGLLAGFAALLARYAGQEDLLVGSPVAGRSRLETEPLIGFFINTAVLRARLDGEPGFRELLGRVRESALGAFAHQDLPFERLVEELSPQRDGSRTPLFQVMLAFQRSALEPIVLPGLTLEPFEPETGTAKFDLLLSFEERGTEIAGFLEYSTDLFEAATAARLAGHLQALLASASADPSVPFTRLRLLSEAELGQLVSGWNETGAARLPGLCVSELFARQAARSPEAPALVASSERLSYRDLDERSDRLARRLAALGVGPEVLVGVCAERTADLVVALLAVLRAGGAYVPLDPNYPEERLALMVEDCRLLLTQSHLSDRLDPWLPRVLLDDLSEPGPGATPAAPVPSNLAYVIYTSGSTGRPKGVAIEHRSVCALIGWAAEAFTPAELSGVLAATSVCFDLSVFELFVPLCLGGRVILAGNALDLPTLADRGEVTLVNTVPSAMSELVLAGSLPSSVLTVLLAGEPLRRSLAEGVRSCGVPRLINGYGPSEDTTYSTASEVLGGSGEPTIGRPLPGSRAYVLDARGELSPTGVPGELLLGGAGLARGYLGRPELTAERFVPDAWSGEAGSRLYRTGDLVRRRPDGDLEFLGRLDHQVKIRGFRIELGEVEIALRGQPGVREAAVVVREEAGDRRLVGYASGEGLSADRLRAGLARLLPSYMVPSAFVLLESLPLTPNGKVDRKALPAPRTARTGSEQDRTAPSDPVEELLAGLWEELLGVGHVGRDDSFFELGGHSLLATRVVSRVRDVLGVALPLRALFDSPTVAGLAGAVRAARGKGLAPAPPIIAVPLESRPEDLPLSFAQQRLWLVDRLEPGSPAYNVVSAVRLTGAVDERLLERIFAEVIRRHEVLRTTFPSPGGMPVQSVAAETTEAHPHLTVMDLRGLPDGERPARALETVREEALRPFDLEHGPLLRLALVLSEEREALLVLTMHHIVSDGWSMGVLVREIGALHAAFSEDRPSPLPELPVQYADYALWQRSWLQGEVLEELLGWWRRELEEAPALLELPTDRLRSPLQSRAGGVETVLLPPDLTAAVQELSRREGATPFMVLLAVFQLLLARFSRQDDVLVGTPVANRTRSEVEGLIGFFVNTLVLRGRLERSLSFRGLLSRTRETALGAFEHQDLPFERLVEDLGLERDLSVSPLFQVLFALQTAPVGRLDLPGLTLEALPLHTGMSSFDLSLDLKEVEGELRGVLEYSLALFDASTVQRLRDSFAHLLRGVVSSPETRIGELPLHGEAERRQILDAWSEPGRAARPAGTVVELFERQVDRSPEAPAVFHPESGATLSYGELDRLANRLARRLRRLGVGPEARVAVLCERTPELIVSFLGVLKAGGVYVPLDPGYPPERLAYMLEDSEPAVLLTQERLAGRVPPSAATVLLLDGDALAGMNEARCNLGAAPGQLAYMLYTSGSTGRPKGVMVSHEALGVYASTVPGLYGLGAGDRVLQFCSVSFDVSLDEIVSSLCGGAEVVLRTESMLESAAAFLESCRAWSISVLLPPTAYWHELAARVESDGLAVPPSLRLMVIGGERALRERVIAWRRAAPAQSRLLNCYGVTEATVMSTVGNLSEPSAAEVRGEVSMGRAMPGAEVYLLEPDGEPAPVGASGEILIGGPFLARGYRNRPDLTAERFVPHPFSAEPGARLYRTGDLARELPSGELEFVGRGDRQVKVRGYRIEVEEIESRLLANPSVESAVVLVLADPRGSQQLVGYVVPRPGSSVIGEDLRSFLRGSLPDAMVPATFVSLESLPLTPNGKLDRRALPEPVWGSGASEDLAAADPMEEMLSGIWAEVLQLGRVGLHEDFFSLGGHSLLATQVVSRIRTVLGVDLPLRSLFESPTVAKLARTIRELRRPGSPETPPIVARWPRPERLPLSFAQQRLWFLDRLEPGGSAFTMAGGLRLLGRLEVPALVWSLSALVERHESLRTSFPEDEEGPVQRIAPASGWELPVLDLSGLARELRDEELDRQTAAEAKRPFDLEAGPLLRTVLLRLDVDDHALLVSTHHVISDGWSQEVFARELAVLYQAACAGEPSPLPPLSIQYTDYALWQQEWFAGPALEHQLSYWRDRLTEPAPQDLATDRPRPEVQTYQGAHRVQRLSPELSESLAALGRRHGSTLFMTLLAALEVLLHRHTGESDLLVGTPIAGRVRAEVEPLIGVFLNTLVLRTDVGGDPGFAELLGRVRETALEAYAHQDLPFEKILSELQPQRDVSRTAYFQVFFNLLNFPEEALALPGLEMRVLRGFELPAKFDLGLYATQRPGGLEISWVYNAGLFDETTIHRLERQYGTLLSALSDRTSERLSRLPLLPASEIHQVLVEWNDSETGPAAEELIHLEIERRAQRSPSASALIWEGGSLDYGTLNREANRLAHGLRARGVGPESVVALCLDRSPELVVAILGVLKSGAAFLPLDASNPVSRLEFLMSDAGVDLLLSTGEHLERLPAWRHLAVDVGESPWAGQPASDPEPLATPDNVAYVIYTSGSTGTPKGAMITHRTLERRLSWMQSVYRVAEGERVLHKASTGFDVAVWETLWPLRVGAAVVVARPGGHQDAAYLRRRIVEERVNLVHFVPSMLELFLSEPEIESCDSLRIVLSGGEPLSLELLGRCRERLPGQLYNQYGMTEACIDVTFWSTRGEAGSGPVPIGRPYGDTSVHLLDGNLRPVPVGAVGDLWVGGDEGLLRGYRGAPHRTATALVPDPLSGCPGSRLYRTGDRARRRPDGTVVYLGRADNQIKLRGLRVAPEEIEGALRQHAEVEQAAVVSRDQRLVAYVRAPAGQSPSSEELRRHLRGRLPEAMIPSAFVLVDGFPKTPSGKLDRLALARRELARSEAAEDGQPGPQTPFEALVAQVWTEVLGVDRVGSADNFFELGGHSLFAAQVVSRLRQKHGVALPLRTAFQKQTLAELAREVERRLRGEDAEDDVPPIAPASEASGPIPMTLAQKPFWRERHLEVAPSTLPIVLRLEGELDASALRESLRRLVDRHSILRTTFGEHEGEPVQLVHAPWLVDLPLVDVERLCSTAQRCQLDRLLPDLLRRPWDLEAGPLFRAFLLRASAREHVFVFLCHHILLDGWAIGIFLRELESVYRSLASGQLPALLPLGLQYRDFALWQHRYLQSRAARMHQDYWRAQFADAAEPTSLPLDRPAPVQPTLLSATLMPTVPPALLERVRELAAHEGKTLFMVILAAIKTMLFHHTRREDLAVMSLYANRNQAEVEDLLGSFYTFLPLRTRLSADQSFRELLAAVQETTLGGYSHSDAIPEDVLTRVWARRGCGNGKPGISRILFALQNLPGSFGDFGGLKMQSVPADSNRIRFDTSFFFYEWSGGLQARLRYSTELFDEASAKRWFEDFLRVLEVAAQDPGRRLADFLPEAAGV